METFNEMQKISAESLFSKRLGAIIFDTDKFTNTEAALQKEVVLLKLPQLRIK
ncbi:hypothetical protein [Azohydromonas lata]|uniref:hypothetical protein n=1 Tax=Azohydromonas lata TaxID=45677 RepID=UPI0012F518AD|nr:hypothetical protein [Azohydromonas lata]